MKKIFFSLFILSLTIQLHAQDKTKTAKEQKKEIRKERITAIARQEEEGVITYTKHILGGIKLTSDGYGAFVEVGRAQSVKKSLLFQLDISEKKHPKEEKQFSQQSNGGPFIYGKINFFYPVKLGVQQQFLLGNRGNKNGVSISGNVGGGLSMGFLRPYLLGYDIGGEQTFKGLADDSTLFITGDPISGPNFGTGFNKMKVVPGAYAKSGLRFDYGKYNEVISALEVGLVGEFYSKAIPQMVFTKHEKFFFSAYVAIIFGKRK